MARGISSASKGAVLGAAAIMAITVLWALPSWPPNEVPDPVPPIVVFAAGCIVGMPCALLIGGAIGRLAGRLVRYRRLILATAAPALALALAAITTASTSPATTPSFETLFARAFVPLALASLALERWTREPERLPVAQLR